MAGRFAVKLLAALCLLLTSCHGLRRADLLFHVSPDGNAITAVTPAMIDHVAIYVGGDSVIEAIPRQGVVTTPLHTVISRENGYYVRGRVKGAHRRLSVSRAHSYLGLPYDSVYSPDDAAIYCSELVLLSMVDRRGRPLLATIPMTFRDSTGLIPPYWQAFYAERGLTVPEGEPGSNPAELSQRPGVVIKKLKY